MIAQSKLKPVTVRKKTYFKCKTQMDGIKFIQNCWNLSKRINKNTFTAPKIKDFFSKCDQILKKSLMENLISWNIGNVLLMLT